MRVGIRAGGGLEVVLMDECVCVCVFMCFLTLYCVWGAFLLNGVVQRWTGRAEQHLCGRQSQGGPADEGAGREASKTAATIAATEFIAATVTAVAPAGHV